MSTRANIILTDNSKDKLFFYRHSDGYPSGALATLKKFMKWVKEKKIRNNVCQAAGWLIILGNVEYEVGTEPMDWKVGAIEPTTEIHGDIRYLYELDLNKKTITVKEAFWSNDKEPVQSFKEVEVITDFEEK